MANPMLSHTNSMPNNIQPHTAQHHQNNHNPNPNGNQFMPSNTNNNTMNMNHVHRNSTAHNSMHNAHPQPTPSGHHINTMSAMHSINMGGGSMPQGMVGIPGSPQNVPLNNMQPMPSHMGNGMGHGMQGS